VRHRMASAALKMENPLLKEFAATPLKSRGQPAALLMTLFEVIGRTG